MTTIVYLCCFMRILGASSCSYFQWWNLRTCSLSALCHAYCYFPPPGLKSRNSKLKTGTGEFEEACEDASVTSVLDPCQIRIGISGVSKSLNWPCETGEAYSKSMGTAASAGQSQHPRSNPCGDDLVTLSTDLVTTRAFFVSLLTLYICSRQDVRPANTRAY